VSALDPHFYRRESGRLVAALVGIFGVHNLALAEDVAQEALVRALETWNFAGVPDNPTAWLIATAKRRAIDVLRRERTARTFAPELGWLLDTEWTLAPTVDELLAPDAFRDEQLRMMFTCCQPKIADEAQVALILSVLCGFGAREIAAAFLSGVAAIEKRIARSKKTLAASKRLFDLDGDGVAERLPVVQRALYLLFNEGYHGACPEAAVRTELCDEAIRLVGLLAEHPRAGTPATFALASLMHFGAARLPARLDASGDLSPFDAQDRSRWDARHIAEGQRLLERSASGDELTAYHLEAAIAAVHARARGPGDTDWPQIVALYDRLLAMRPSPVVALGRALAVAQFEGPLRGLDEIARIDGVARLATYPFYPAALGELEFRAGRCDVARRHFERALAIARNEAERRHLARRIEACGGERGAQKSTSST
jgi:RNA polymerase sigma-70 factor (ECF subfamily)